jgi:hypothetical protein
MVERFNRRLGEHLDRMPQLPGRATLGRVAKAAASTTRQLATAAHHRANLPVRNTQAGAGYRLILAAPAVERRQVFDVGMDG